MTWWMTYSIQKSWLKKVHFNHWCLKVISLELHSSFSILQIFSCWWCKARFFIVQTAYTSRRFIFFFLQGSTVNHSFERFCISCSVKGRLRRNVCDTRNIFLAPPRKILGGGQNNSRERGGKFFFTHLRKL